MKFLNDIAIAAPPAPLVLAIAPMGWGDAATGNPASGRLSQADRVRCQSRAATHFCLYNVNVYERSEKWSEGAATRAMLATRAVAMSETPKKFASAPIAVGPGTATHGFSAPPTPQAAPAIRESKTLANSPNRWKYRSLRCTSTIPMFDAGLRTIMPSQTDSEVVREALWRSSCC
jgi:hypothetical protein